MKYLKLYEDFIELETEIDKIELSDLTVDDILNNNTSFIDSKGVVHIENWKVY